MHCYSRFLFTFFAAMVASESAHSQQDEGLVKSQSLQLELSFHTKWSRYGQEPMAVLQASHELDAWARDHGDCDSLQVAQTLLLSIANQSGDTSPLDSVLNMPVWCDTTMHTLWYNIGVRHFIRQEQSKALVAFEEAEGVANGNGQRVTALQAMGTVASAMGNRRRAYDHFLAAYQLDSNLNHPVFLNNLGVMSTYLGDHDASRVWFNRALESLTLQMDFPGMAEDFDQTLRVNLLLLECMVGDTSAADRRFNQIDASSLCQQDVLSGIGVIGSYLLWRNDSVAWQTILPKLSTQLASVPVAEAKKGLQDIAGLFPSLWDNGHPVPWHVVRRVPPKLQLFTFPPPSGPVPREVAPPAKSPASSRLLSVLVGVCVMLVAGGGALRHRRRRRAREATADEAEALNWSEAIAELEGVLEGRPGLRTEEALGVVGAGLVQIQSQQNPYDNILNVLNAKEQEVFQLALQGLRPKEIAQQLDCHPTYVYNLRTNIRKKLGVDGDVDLRVWWMNRWKDQQQ